MKCVILAGGKGTRLAPYTAALPKPLVPVGGVPILEVIVRQLAAAGFTGVTISLGHLGALIREFVAAHGDLARSVDVTFVEEAEPAGTAGPLLLVPDLPETFLMMNGDVLTTLSYRRLAEFHRHSGAVLTIAGHRKRFDIDLGVLRLDAAGDVVGYDEKPSLTYPVSMGVYAVERRALEYIPPGRRFDVPDLVGRLLADSQKVACFESDAVWFDIGRREDYEAAQEELGRLRGEPGMEGLLPGNGPGGA